MDAVFDKHTELQKEFGTIEQGHAEPKELYNDWIQQHNGKAQVNPDGTTTMLNDSVRPDFSLQSTLQPWSNPSLTHSNLTSYFHIPYVVPSAANNRPLFMYQQGPFTNASHHPLRLPQFPPVSVDIVPVNGSARTSQPSQDFPQQNPLLILPKNPVSKPSANKKIVVSLLNEPISTKSISIVIPEIPEIVTIPKRKEAVTVLKWGTIPIRIERTSQKTAVIPNGFESESNFNGEVWIGQVRVLPSSSVQYRFYLKADPSKVSDWHRTAVKAYRDAESKLDPVSKERLDSIKRINARKILGLTYESVQSRIRTIFNEEIAELETRLEQVDAFLSTQTEEMRESLLQKRIRAFEEDE